MSICFYQSVCISTTIHSILITETETTMTNIKVTIIGMGNCASSLIQGIHYYRNQTADDSIGLMHWSIGDYLPGDIEIIAAFDIDRRKVGLDINEAIFSKPNCTTVFCKDLPKSGTKVLMGNILDGFSDHMTEYPDDATFILADTVESTKEEVIHTLKDSGTHVLMNYFPLVQKKPLDSMLSVHLKQALPL